MILVPRVTRVDLLADGEKVTGGDVYVNIDKDTSVVINAEIGPKDSRQKVKWSVSGDESLYINRRRTIPPLPWITGTRPAW